MSKISVQLIAVVVLACVTSGCAIVSLGLSAAAGYAIYQATQD